MIQGIFCFQFVLNQSPSGEIEPEFKPVQIVLKNEEFTPNNYSGLMVENDIFAIFYQHTTGIYASKGGHSNYYTGRLKETPYQVISYYKQEADGTQYITISIFELDDEIAIFEDLIKDLTIRLDNSFETLLKANAAKQTSIILKINEKIKTDISFTIFQVERLANLDRLQKVALIFNTRERLTILKTLRETPVSKSHMKDILEKIKPVFNIDILIEPFLELNLIRRDWIKGEKDRATGRMKFQGEYLFLVKDITLARIPNNTLLEHLKTSNPSLQENFEQRTIDFFSKYDPLLQTDEDLGQISMLLLNPDIYDFLALMRKNYYPVAKIPKVFSEYANTQKILDWLKEIQVIVDVKDGENREFTCLLTDIKPLIIFPEYLLPKIQKAYQSYDKKVQISHEIAKKALELLEVTYPEKIDL